MAEATRSILDLDEHAMPLETAELLAALGAVTQHIPRLIRDIASSKMAPDRQREFAGMLAGLADVMREHADFLDGGVAATHSPAEVAVRAQLPAPNSPGP
ncbi:hypothetical protein [Amycolatopsis sp. NPDC051716]|uniref:hypothetical protein n=1 Tax=Amycolatopsis sp. NPDC051716 TaxID=3155804 RepID=UPI00343A0DD2